MTSVRVWDGTKWNSNVQYNTNTPLLPRWEQWHPPQTTTETGAFNFEVRRCWVTRNSDGVLLQDWHFNSNAMGWHYGDLTAPAWSGGDILVKQLPTSNSMYPNSDYVYSEEIDVATVVARMTVILNSCTGPLPTVRSNLYYDGIKSKTETHLFTAVPQEVTLEWPSTVISGLFCDFQTYIDGAMFSSPASEVTSVKIWNGSTWLVQNAY